MSEVGARSGRVPAALYDWLNDGVRIGVAGRNREASPSRVRPG